MNRTLAAAMFVGVLYAVVITFLAVAVDGPTTAGDHVDRPNRISLILAR